MVGSRKSVEDMRDVLRAESKADLADLRAEYRRGSESFEAKLVVHELEHHRK